jgi:hypothetical protein
LSGILMDFVGLADQLEADPKFIPALLQVRIEFSMRMAGWL